MRYDLAVAGGLSLYASRRDSSRDSVPSKQDNLAPQVRRATSWQRRVTSWQQKPQDSLVRGIDVALLARLHLLVDMDSGLVASARVATTAWSNAARIERA